MNCKTNERNVLFLSNQPSVVTLQNWNQPIRDCEETTVSVSLNKETLSVEFNCRQSNMSLLRCNKTRRNDDLWEDDCVELILSDGTNHYHLILNARAVPYEAKNGLRNWRPDYERQSAIGKDSWKVQLRLPLLPLGLKPEIFRLNLAREDKSHGTISSWHQASDFTRIDQTAWATTLTPEDFEAAKRNFPECSPTVLPDLRPVKTKCLELGGQRELFVDDYLLDKCVGTTLCLHHPVRREIVFELDEPHERCNNSSFHSLVQAGNKWRLYYPAGRWCPTPGHPETGGEYRICVIETSDGRHWERCPVNRLPSGPNVVFDKSFRSQNPAVTPGSANCAVVFRDTNPDCDPRELYKMLVVGDKLEGRGCLSLMVSKNGFEFRACDLPAFALESDYDSQNTCFYDPVIRQYRLFHRVWHFGMRGIRTHLTRDFYTFSNSTDLLYDDNYTMHMYTNQIQPYFRAPHILMGFPMRYDDCDDVWNEAILSRPNLAIRTFLSDEKRGGIRRVGLASTDTLFMTSRDGWHFHRHAEAFLPPGPAHPGSWMYGDGILAWGMMPTKSDLAPEAPDELSFFAVENKLSEKTCALRRCTLRMDGFVSLHFPAAGGEAISKPFRFSGDCLSLNLATSAWGRYAVEIQNEAGQPLLGFALEDFAAASGDDVSIIARWHGNSDLRKLAGQPVRLRFVAHDCDLYALQFVPAKSETILTN